jgi:hypothetical protein
MARRIEMAAGVRGKSKRLDLPFVFNFNPYLRRRIEWTIRAIFKYRLRQVDEMHQGISRRIASRFPVRANGRLHRRTPA